MEPISVTNPDTKQKLLVDTLKQAPTIDFLIFGLSYSVLIALSIAFFSALAILIAVFVLPSI